MSRSEDHRHLLAALRGSFVPFQLVHKPSRRKWEILHVPCRLRSRLGKEGGMDNWSEFNFRQDTQKKNSPCPPPSPPAPGRLPLRFDAPRLEARRANQET